MPIFYSALQRSGTKIRIPFLEAVAIVLAGDRELEGDPDTRDDLADRRHGELIQRHRGRVDRRDYRLAELKAVLPADKRAALEALEEEWADEAIAREEAAYRIGVLVEQGRGCRACRSERRRISRIYRDWLRLITVQNAADAPKPAIAARAS